MYNSVVRNEAEYAANARAFGEKVALTQREIEQLRPLLVTEKGKQVVTKLAQDVADYADAGRNLIDQLRAGQSTEAERLAVEKLTPAGNRLVQQIGDFVEVQNTYEQKASQEAGLTVSRSVWAFIVLLVVGLTVSVLVTLAIRRLSMTLHGISKQLTTGAQEVSSAAGQTASASQELAQGSSQQAMAVERISSAVEEIAALTRQNRDSATEAANLMGNAQQTGALVRESLAGLETAVGEIHDSNGQIGRILHSIEKCVRKDTIEIACSITAEALQKDIQLAIGWGQTFIVDSKGIKLSSTFKQIGSSSTPGNQVIENPARPERPRERASEVWRRPTGRRSYGAPQSRIPYRPLGDDRVPQHPTAR
jgi:hypothetical protein